MAKFGKPKLNRDLEYVLWKKYKMHSEAPQMRRRFTGKSSISRNLTIPI